MKEENVRKKEKERETRHSAIQLRKTKMLHQQDRMCSRYRVTIKGQTSTNNESKRTGRASAAKNDRTEWGGGKRCTR